MGHVCVEVEIVRDLFVAFFNQFHINHNNLVVAGGFDGALKKDGSITVEIQAITGATNELGFNRMGALEF